MKVNPIQEADAEIRAVVLGPPGSGKGTQAEKACGRFGCIRISTGDLLREVVRNRTLLGRKVKSLLEGGALVADDLIGKVVEEKLCSADGERGFLLDGFPRTRPQVEILDRILERAGNTLDAALYLDVEEAEILRRLGGRRVCGSCGGTFHVEYQPPERPDICDTCGGKLEIRKDDRQEVIRERLRVYRRETAPVVDCYRDRGLLRTIPANGSPDEVSERFQAQLAEVAS